MKLFSTHKPVLENCPIGLKNNLLGWKNLNPSFEFEYFDDGKMERWMQDNCSVDVMESFSSLNTGAAKADFYRIKKLFVEGGVWVDADLLAFDILNRVPNLFDMLEKHKTVFFVGKTTNEPRFVIMASQPNNPIFFEFQNQICKELERFTKSKEFVDTINLTGPWAFHRLLCGYLGYEKITQLKVGDHFSSDGISFIFAEDPLESSAKCDIPTYKNYKKELAEMRVNYHGGLIAYKQNSV